MHPKRKFRRTTEPEREDGESWRRARTESFRRFRIERVRVGLIKVIPMEQIRKGDRPVWQDRPL